MSDKDRFGELKGAFIQASQLNTEDQLMLVTLISRIRFASQIENEVSKFEKYRREIDDKK